MKSNELLVLGIESTAHTFGISILKGNDFLSNKRDLFTTNEGGMIPAKVADHHVEVCDKILVQALEESKIKLKDIDIIALSSSPGIGHMLRIGAVFARSLSLQLKIPVIGVNHCIAHLEIGRFFSKSKDPILLYASGANTQIIAYEAEKYRIFGETLDIGVGNFIDSFARVLGLGFPGGPKVEKLALEAKNKEKLIELPYSVKGMDIALGGILTNLKHKVKEKKYSYEALCYSVQETVFAMLTEITERAVAHTGKKAVVLGGGVACNKRLQRMVKEMCEARGVAFYCPENQYLVDNAAMIALTGKLIYEDAINKKLDTKKEFTIEQTRINPYKRTDEIEIKYREK